MAWMVAFSALACLINRSPGVPSSFSYENANISKRKDVKKNNNNKTIGLSNNLLLLLINFWTHFVFVFNGWLKDYSHCKRIEDSQHFIESKVGVTYVFPLDKNQILWRRSSIVARYGNGLSIRGCHGSTSTHCNTKSSSVLLLLNPLCAGLHQKQKTTIWTALAHDGSPASGATCAFLILGSVLVNLSVSSF